MLFGFALMFFLGTLKMNYTMHLKSFIQYLYYIGIYFRWIKASNAKMLDSDIFSQEITHCVSIVIWLNKVL